MLTRLDSKYFSQPFDSHCHIFLFTITIFYLCINLACIETCGIYDGKHIHVKGSFYLLNAKLEFFQRTIVVLNAKIIDPKEN